MCLPSKHPTRSRESTAVKVRGSLSRVISTLSSLVISLKIHSSFETEVERMACLIDRYRGSMRLKWGSERMKDSMCI